MNVIYRCREEDLVLDGFLAALRHILKGHHVESAVIR